ncbi:hypothetical protein I4U23_024760 [Adineta vaga]|nr:hypothetical protein I4U23_024760 [Adineta vaga]
MAETSIINIVQVLILVIIVFLALIYSIPILFIPRFHSINNVFSVNLCIAGICCGTCWLANFISLHFYPSTLSNYKVCVVMNYFEMMCTLQVPLAIVTTSFHRLCSIVYHTKPFFKKKRWAVLCMSSQWVAGMILLLPGVSFNASTCDVDLWVSIYTFLMYVVIPSAICLTNNILIFQHVRSSTNRVQPSIPIPTMTINKKQHPHINRRDLHLLPYMIISFCIFIGGWIRYAYGHH